jgi:hypothetical protein
LRNSSENLTKRLYIEGYSYSKDGFGVVVAVFVCLLFVFVFVFLFVCVCVFYAHQLALTAKGKHLPVSKSL